MLAATPSIPGGDDVDDQTACRLSQNARVEERSSEYRLGCHQDVMRSNRDRGETGLQERREPQQKALRLFGKPH